MCIDVYVSVYFIYNFSYLLCSVFFVIFLDLEI